MKLRQAHVDPTHIVTEDGKNFAGMYDSACGRPNAIKNAEELIYRWNNWEDLFAITSNFSHWEWQITNCPETGRCEACVKQGQCHLPREWNRAKEALFFYVERLKEEQVKRTETEFPSITIDKKEYLKDYPKINPNPGPGALSPADDGEAD